MGLDDVDAEGSGVAQASLDAQGSAVEKPEKAAGAGGTNFEGAWEGAAGAERLNAELTSEEAWEGLLVGLDSLVGGGSEKSKRSFKSDAAGAFVEVAVLGGLKSRLPKSRDTGLAF